jgi:hypothetical protein
MPCLAMEACSSSSQLTVQQQQQACVACLERSWGLVSAQIVSQSVSIHYGQAALCLCSHTGAQVVQQQLLRLCLNIRERSVVVAAAAVSPFMDMEGGSRWGAMTCDQPARQITLQGVSCRSPHDLCQIRSLHTYMTRS